MHPALRDIGLECQNILVRLMAYVGGVAVLAVIAADVFGPKPSAVSAPSASNGMAPKSAWIAATRSHPAFAVPLADLSGKTESYSILRHSHSGGRKDILSWADNASGRPVVHLEIYRPGAELGAFQTSAAALAASAGLSDPDQAEPAGILASKFGAVTLLRFSPPGAAQNCLGFARGFAQPRLQLSGWACMADAPASRSVIACALDRLTLLSAGNDPDVAALFAQAELRRGACGGASAVTAPAADDDWITAAAEPRLRGRLSLR